MPLLIVLLCECVSFDLTFACHLYTCMTVLYSNCIVLLPLCSPLQLACSLARLLAPSLTHSLTVEQTGYVQKQLVQKHWLSIPVLMVVLKVLLQSAWAIAHWKIHDLIFRTDSETIQ